MQTIRYIQYFFYLASNWNLRIAWHILDKEIKGEKKYGIQTTGADDLQKYTVQFAAGNSPAIIGCADHFLLVETQRNTQRDATKDAVAWERFHKHRQPFQRLGGPGRI